MSPVRFVPMKVTPLGMAPRKESELLRLIEIAGRTAYKSEDRITDDSARAFVLMLKKHEHLSVLEHSNIVLSVRATSPLTVGVSREFSPEAISTTIVRALGARNAYHRVFLQPGRPSDGFALAGNVRSWIETLRQLEEENAPCQAFLNHHLNRFFPALFERASPAPESWPLEVSLMDESDQLDLLRREPASDLPLFVFKIVCDRGITHELVRHRVFSFTQESTRYVNYGNRGMTMILPEELQPFYETERGTFREENSAVREWLHRAETIFDWYQKDLERGLRPEIARDILPNLLKSEIFVSGRWSGWEHFIRLRGSKQAHPRIRFIAHEVRGYFESIGMKVD